MNIANQRLLLVAELQALAQSSNRSKRARLCEIFDEVEAALAAGTTQKQVIAALERHGLTFTLRSFETTYARLKNERRQRNTNGKKTCDESIIKTLRHVETTPTVNEVRNSSEEVCPDGITKPQDRKAASIAKAEKYTSDIDKSYLESILKGKTK